jgi:phage recombination protein Bet
MPEKEPTVKDTGKALAKHRPQTKDLQKFEFDEETVALIKAQIAPKATDNELKLFLYQCQRTGLDPLTRQIYCIHRYDKQTGGNKMTVQTSIDGFRVIAERSGSYAGQSEPEFYYNAESKLHYCKIRVYKFGPGNVRYEAAVAVAFWAEYVQTSPLWVKMPHVMLSKVAEALALRKAFPQDLSGLYTDDEIATHESAFTVEIENKEAPKPPAKTPVNLTEEATVLEVTTTPAPPVTPAVVSKPWEYDEARKTIANMLLTYSKLEPGSDQYLTLFSYIKGTDGKIMNKATYDKIKAELLKPESIREATPDQVKAAIKAALATKGLTNPDGPQKAVK